MRYQLCLNIVPFPNVSFYRIRCHFHGLHAVIEYDNIDYCFYGRCWSDERPDWYLRTLLASIVLVFVLRSSFKKYPKTTTMHLTLYEIVLRSASTLNSFPYFETCKQMVMGANIGTSVTSTIVAIGQIADDDEFERAFAGATVHDMFNWMSVAILLPVEAATGYLYYLTEAITKNITPKDGEKNTTFIKEAIGAAAKQLIIANKKIPEVVAQGGSCEEDFYPVMCDDPENPTKSTCSVGLIACDSDYGCPALFDPYGTIRTDTMAGVMAFIFGIFIIFVGLTMLVVLLQGMLLGASTRIIHKATDINGYLAMLIGAGITMAVQSSSITTSTLTPLVGMGLIRLEQMYPLTLGANLGTTLTGIMASLVANSADSIQVALAHLFFNITGIIIFYPIPFMRKIPLNAARQLGKATRAWKGFPILYLVLMFLLMPAALLGISYMFQGKTTAGIAVGSILVVLIALGIVAFVYWWHYKDGRGKAGMYFAQRKRRVIALETLPYDMHWAERKIKELQEQTGCDGGSPSRDSSESKDVYVTMADDIEYVMDSVQALIEHTGLPKEEEKEAVLPRFVHKENETMPDVDMSGWLKYQIIYVGTIVVCLAFIFWGIGVLYADGSVGYVAMGGLLTAFVGAWLIFMIARFIKNKNQSVERYTDIELKKICKETYTSKMAQMKADVDKLVTHTNLPSFEGEKGGKTSTAVKSTDDVDEEEAEA